VTYVEFSFNLDHYLLNDYLTIRLKKNKAGISVEECC